jgi:hypothetical protein
LTVDDRLVAQAAAAVRAAGLGWVVEAAPPASDAAIAECEARLAVPLPTSYRNLLRKHDGVTLGIDVTQYYRAELELFGTRLIVERNAEELGRTVTVFKESVEGLIVFSDTMDGDLCLFDRTQSRGDAVPVLFADHENDPDGWRTKIIARDFALWFSEVLEFVINSPAHNDFRYWWSRDWKLT